MEYRKFSDLPNLDKDIIKGTPWAENMLRTLEHGLTKTFLYWCQMVLTVDETEEVLNQWVNIFKTTYEETCCDLVSDMERVHRDVLLKIEHLLQEFEQQCHTLQIEMPLLGDATQKLSLYQDQQELKKRINENKIIIEKRQAELNKLREKQLDLCNSLGKEPIILKDNPLPSADEMEEFQKHIEKLEGEKFSRLEKFLTIKENILEIIKELNVKPSTQFEKDICSSDDSVFLVTDANMKKLELLQNRLIKQQKTVSEEIATLRNKTDDLWNLLEVDLKEREIFRQEHTGNTIDVLEAFRTEIRRCEGLKKANIKVFIDKLRDELERLWYKCRCSEDMKRQFAYLHSDCYTEDLLQLHEIAIDKWKKYYDENKEILTLIEKHQQLWNKMKELEENATGPSRYNNRGGQLLKEEKERNKLAKQIPQIEQLISDLAQKFEQTHDHAFTTFGTPILEYLAVLHEERENEKKLKLSARKMQREQTLTPAKSALSIFPSPGQHTLRSGTPLYTKRKLATPLASGTKRLRVLNEKNNQTPASEQLPAIKITSVSGRSKRYSVERNKRINKIRRLSAQKEQVNANETIPVDYGTFQEQLSNRDDCRSTIIPSEATPISTPRSRTLRCKTPTSILGATPRTPLSSRRRPRTPDTNSKLSTAKSNLKLIF